MWCHRILGCLAQCAFGVVAGGGLLVVGTGDVRAEVKLGSDVLAASGFKELRGKRVGLITNPSGVNARGVSTVDLLRSAPGVKLVALFGPEHGVEGKVQAGKRVADQQDGRTGLRVYSLYGATRKPTPSMLEGVDVMVYDLQDTGCRSYTYISTMGLAMEACAETGVEMVILDRPNPLGGDRVEGPRVEPAYRSFVSQWDVPYVYGMTCGELARMINGERWISKPCRLTVVPMQGWERWMTWADTGLPWVPTSPNIPRADSPLHCAATGIFGELAGGSGLSIGGKFDRPFACVLAPWLEAASLSRQMNRYGLEGIRFAPLTLTRENQKWQGIELRIADRARSPLVAVNFYLWDAIKRTTGRDVYREAVKAKRDFSLFDKVNGTGATRRAMAAGKSPAEIVSGWHAGEAAFRGQRRRYLLYPERPRPGSTLGAPANGSDPAYRSITIRRGDTLTRIAKDLGVTVSDIVEANPGLDADKIKAGQTLRVPRRRR